MNSLRLGIIGMGNIGKHHADYLSKGKVSRCKLVAVCDAVAPLDIYRPLKTFTDGEALIRSGEVDAVIIATPHFQHTTLGVSAIEAGVHVMVEKPISSHKADAEKLIAAHKRNPNVVFGGMFQLRTEPRYQTVRKLFQDGELGKLVRFNWINTDWYRTEAYYAASGWRATWKGEGGGVLLNQCLHNLDTLYWLLGMPQCLRGFCQFGRFHQIEVEDNVTAYLEWPNGATGAFVSSTGEAPGTNRLEIIGSQGKLVMEHDELVLMRNAADMLEFSQTATQGFVKPDTTRERIPFDNAALPHAIIMQNFVNAVLDDEPLIVPGEEGIYSVELANAMVYSSLLGETVELPLNGAAWEAKLGQLIAESRVQKKVVTAGTADFSSSFRR